MALPSPLTFVLAPAARLPQGSPSPEALNEAQLAGLSSGFALRIFSRGAAHTDLAQLPLDGRLTGDQRRSSDGTQLLCDAVVIGVQPMDHWLGVYGEDPEDPSALRCLDQVALGELNNSTCWFYPTHDGTYLSWQRDLCLRPAPGQIADCPEELRLRPYERSLITVLWSLLGDSDSLTCVGFTYGGQRLDWPLQSSRFEDTALWRRFRVDSQADPSLLIEDGLMLGAPA